METEYKTFLPDNFDTGAHETNPAVKSVVALRDSLLLVRQYRTEKEISTPKYPVDKNMAIIIFIGDCLADIERFLNTVDNSTIIFDKEDCGFVFIANKTDIDEYIKKYGAETTGPNGHKKAMDTQQAPKFLTDNIRSVRQDMYEVLQTAPLRDRINLLYLLCSGNIVGDQTFILQQGFDTTIKQFMLNQLSTVDDLNSTEEIEALILKLAYRFILAPDIWNTKIAQYNKTLGMLKFSNPLFLDVVVSDGQRTNLFNLEKSKQYTIMNGICVSKLKIDYDFSNLCINGNFVCTNVKKNIVLPKQINGLLDCSYCGFKITNVPFGTTTANLSFTVKSFAELNQIEFPSTVSNILIAKSTINNATKDVNELQEIQSFMKKYPDICIWDNHQHTTLAEALEKSLLISEEKKQKESESVTAIVKEKKRFEDKTPDWKTRKEILDILSKDSRFANVTNLDRLIQRATNQHGRNILKHKMHEGQPVPCVHETNIDFLIDVVLEIITDDELRINTQKTDKNNQPTTTNKEKKLKDNQHTKKTTNKKPKPIHIEKYIPKNVWKNICDSCNDSLNLKIQFLEEINKINIDYTKQKNSGAVQYIDENGQVQVISNIRKKDGNCVAQNLGTNRKRIVWTINPVDNIIVAITYMEEHSDSIRTAIPYMEARKFAAKCQNLDGVSVTRDLVIQNNYLSVSDLLNEYKSLQNTPKSDDTPMQFPTVTENEPQSSNDNDTIIKDANTTKTEPVVQNTTNNQTSQKQITKRKRRYDLVDLISVEKEVQEIIQKLDYEITRLSKNLTRQKNNPHEQMNTLKQIEKLIREKMKYCCK